MSEMISVYWVPLLVVVVIIVAIGWRAWAKRRSLVANTITSMAEAVTGAGLGAVDASIGMAKAAAHEVADVVHHSIEGVEAVVSGAAPLAKPKIAPAVGAPDDLLQIKGIGPKLNILCHNLGVSRFDQIATWKAGDIAEVDQHLGSFRGRIARDNWVEQAGLLAKGDIAAFEAKYGKLDSENKTKK